VERNVTVAAEWLGKAAELARVGNDQQDQQAVEAFAQLVAAAFPAGTAVQVVRLTGAVALNGEWPFLRRLQHRFHVATLQCGGRRLQHRFHLPARLSDGVARHFRRRLMCCFQSVTNVRFSLPLSRSRSRSLSLARARALSPPLSLFLSLSPPPLSPSLPLSPLPSAHLACHSTRTLSKTQAVKE
jgi:hypothetical protein